VFHPEGLDDITDEVALYTEVTASNISSQFAHILLSLYFMISLLMPDNANRSYSKPSPDLPIQVPFETSRLQTSLTSASQDISSNETTGTEDVPSESNIIACLGHLAYKQDRPTSINVPDSSKVESRAPATKLQFPRNKVGCLGKDSVPDFDLTKCDVGPLLTCVSCGVRWTIKKDAAHKLSHITTCARKKGINPSTLHRLIERELLKLRHTKTNNKEAATCSDSANTVSQTYVESVVASAQQKKKQRRTDTARTLQPVSQTRAAILDRAKVLLGAWGAVPRDAPEPESTQAFGRSKLATGQMQAEKVNPTESHLSEEECALTRLALLRSMANSHTTCPSQGARSMT
jgi:hypothetical protein